MSEETVAGLVDIAVLDDDIDFRNYIEDLLRDEGRYAVRSFAEPAELFAAAESSIPDIVLLDMKMGAGLRRAGARAASGPLARAVHYRDYRLSIAREHAGDFQAARLRLSRQTILLSQLRQALQNAIERFGLGRIPQDLLRERLGHRIKLLRVERDWSLKDLAAATRLSVSQISSIERGANLPSVESLLAICRAFDRKPSEVLLSIGF